MYRQALQSRTMHLLGAFPKSMTLVEACCRHSLSIVQTYGT